MGKHFTIRETETPDLPQMMLATVRALKETGGSATIHEIHERVVEMEGVTEHEQSILLPDGKRRKLNYYLAWARSFLKRNGALENSSRGVWALSDKGNKITSIDRARSIHDEARAGFREDHRSRHRSGKKPVLTGDNKKQQQQVLDYDATTEWRNELLEAIQAMGSDAFERLARRLLREAGFTKIDVIEGSGDGGINGIGLLRVNLVSFQVYFQCKRWRGRVGAGEIRNFRGALQGRTDKGLFITNTDFTPSAYQEATRAPAIDLIDGEHLCELIKEFGLGVKTEQVEKVTIDRNWFESV